MLLSTITLFYFCVQAIHAYDYRPYFYWQGRPLQSTTQQKLFVAFGLQHGTDSCVPVFNGPLTTGIVGQNIILSFGGADGTYVNQNCNSASMLQKNLLRVVDAVSPVGLDFDLEGSNGHCNNLGQLAAAVASIKSKRLNLLVGVTIAAFEGGIATWPPANPGDCIGKDILTAFSNAGVYIDYINIMNMYLDTPDSQITTETYLTVISKSLETIRQVPGYADWPLSKLGVTFTNEGGNGKLTVGRAKNLVARLPKDLAFVSMWDYKDLAQDGGESEKISGLFRNAIGRSTFGPSARRPWVSKWGFGAGAKIKLTFDDGTGQKVTINGVA